jgi:hypothetical protein
MKEPTFSLAWRCTSCGNILGIDTGGRLEVRWKAAAYTYTGTGEVTTDCRRCGGHNRFQLPAATRQPVPPREAA